MQNLCINVTSLNSNSKERKTCTSIYTISISRIQLSAKNAKNVLIPKKILINTWAKNIIRIRLWTMTILYQLKATNQNRTLANRMIMKFIKKKATAILNQTSWNQTFAQNVEKSVMTWETFQITSSKLIMCSIIPFKALV